MTIREEHFSSAHFIRYSRYPSPTLSFRAQREIFLALRSFLLLSQKVSPFPLSHIRHYPLLQERSLDFARDDDTGIALSKHIRCTLREINPFPHTVISSAARNLPRTPRFLASFAEAFPFSVSHIGRYTDVQERSRASLGMTLCEYHSLTLPIYFPCNNDTREAPSTFAALLCFYAPHYHPEPINLNPEPKSKKPQPKLELFRRRFASYLPPPNCASMVPAATAVPITPATFGPIACISR